MSTRSRNGQPERVQLGIAVDPEVYAVVKYMALLEDRPMGYIARRLLKTHPIVIETLEAIATANAEGATA